MPYNQALHATPSRCAVGFPRSQARSARVSAGVSRPGKENLCLNLDQPVSTATRRCLPRPSKHAFAPTSARSAQRASKMFLATSAQTAVVGLFLAQSDLRRTGRVTTFLARTQRARRSSTGQLMPQHTHSSLPKSESFRRSNGSPCVRGRLTRRSSETPQKRGAP